MSNAGRQVPKSPADPAALTVPALAITLERVRRTTHIDGASDDDGTLRVDAAARDLVRDADAARPVREARLTARLDRRREVTVIETGTDLSALVGAQVGPGFRARAAAVLPEDPGLPLSVLVADLPTAALLSGYARIRNELEAGAASGDVVGCDVLEVMTDVCAGWGAGGTNVDSIAAGEGVPAESILGCPPAPPLQHPEFPLAWHDLPPLEPGALRRARRIDVARAGGEVVVDAFFRDTYMSSGTSPGMSSGTSPGMSATGTEVVLHEYSLYAWLDPDLVVLEIEATPRVLPFPECPVAAEQVKTLIGVRATDLGTAVREQLAGTAGCTHLNDLLGQLGHLPRLLELLP